MLRDEGDLELLAELAGVLDQTVSAEGLSSGTYLVLRELDASDGPHEITTMAESLSATPDEVADMCGLLSGEGLAEPMPNGMTISPEGADKARAIADRANEAMKAYVVDRPHTATVYGLVASMQGGRFTVEDLIEFLQQGPDVEEVAS